MNSFSKFLKKRKLRKAVDSIITLNNEREEIIEDLGLIPEECDDILQRPLIEEPPKTNSKKVNINITLNLNVKESDADKLISILDSYF